MKSKRKDDDGISTEAVEKPMFGKMAVERAKQVRQQLLVLC
jgi:hypothetical protein